MVDISQLTRISRYAADLAGIMVNGDTGMITILQGDVVEQLQTLPDASVQCVVTSPPYDDLRSYKDNPTFDLKGTITGLFRVLIDGGVVVWVVGDSTINGSESGTSFRQALLFMESGFNLHDTMIYMKNGPAYPSKNRYYSIFEYMFVFSKGAPRTINLIKDRENRWDGLKWSNKRTRRDREGTLRESEWNPSQGGKYGVRFNIWKYAVGHGYSTKDEIAYQHPAIFPEALAEDHIMSWSNKGDTILDPFAGSGTTLKAAHALNRNAIGIEINSEYVKIIKERLRLNEQLVILG